MHKFLCVEIRGQLIALSLNRVASKDKTQVIIRLGSKCLYPLTHFVKLLSVCLSTRGWVSLYHIPSCWNFLTLRDSHASAFQMLGNLLFY